jgi:hypothetical protein
MPLRFGDIELLGPFGRLDELEDQPGLFVILCYQGTTFEPLDVRIAELVQTEVAEALDEAIWIDMCTGKLRVAVLYSSNDSVLHYTRLRIVASEGLTESKDLANVLLAKARSAMDEGKYDDAVRYYRAATKSLEKTFGEEDKRLLILLDDLLKLLKAHGQEGAAFGVQERIMRIIGKDKTDEPAES